MPALWSWLSPRSPTPPWRVLWRNSPRRTAVLSLQQRWWAVWDSSQGTVHNIYDLEEHFNIWENWTVVRALSVLKSNGTHFIYENTVMGDVDPHESLISREKSIRLHFSCEYPLDQALSMDVGINPVERWWPQYLLTFMCIALFS